MFLFLQHLFCIELAVLFSRHWKNVLVYTHAVHNSEDVLFYFPASLQQPRCSPYTCSFMSDLISQSGAACHSVFLLLLLIVCTILHKHTEMWRDATQSVQNLVL